MTESDLEKLKHVAVPPAREDARRAAIAAALAAFDDASPKKKSDQAAQGNAGAHRPTGTINSSRSFLMTLTKRHNMAIAASIVAMALAAPIAFKLHHEWREAAPQSIAPDIGTLANAEQKQRAKMKTEAPSTPHQVAEKDEPAPPPEPSKPLADKADSTTVANLPGDTTGRTLEDGRLLSRLAPSTVPSPAPAPNEAAVMASKGIVGDYEPNVSAATARPEARMQDYLADSAKVANEYKDHDVFNAPEINPVKQVATEPVSTFSFDVDTASYSFLRRALNSGHLPPKGAVRVEELINYFPYNYPAAPSADVPFKPTVTVMPAPWKPTDKLVHIAIRGYDLKPAERPRANLVFLLDISGSMESEDRLPLVKNALHLLVDQLQGDDTVGIVTYASGSGIALEPTKISDKGKILAAIDKLEAGGSTDGADGIADAYRLAEANLDKKAVNRIVLATDGDFNVGITDREQLKSFVERKRSSGIFLSVLGVGQGNHNDAMMQTLAQNGNGTAAYVDTLNEARKVLVDEATSTLFTIAKDVKAQVEWNPARVSQYRLIGYETRALNREDFNNDRVDAGDIGSGHTVTAIYEVTPVGAPAVVDDLRYGKTARAAAPVPATDKSGVDANELGFLKIRYKKPNEDTSQLLSVAVTDDAGKPDSKPVPDDVRFSVAVAAFGDLVRGAPFVEGYRYDDVIALAQTARGDDPFGYRAEFLNLVRLAKSARP